MELAHMRAIADVLASRQIGDGTPHKSRNARGNAKDRLARQNWLLTTYGDGNKVPCLYCGRQLTRETLTVDRLLPGSQGGRYIRANIMPACEHDNKSRGDTPYKAFNTADSASQWLAVSSVLNRTWIGNRKGKSKMSAPKWRKPYVVREVNTPERSRVTNDRQKMVRGKLVTLQRRAK